MLNPVKTVLFGLGAACLNLQIVDAQDTFEFRYKAAEGTQQHYKLESDISQTQKINGQSITSRFAVTQVVVREAAKADEKGNLVFRERKLSIKAETKISRLGEYTYDSKALENDSGSTLGAAITPLYDAISGAVVNLTVSPQGEVLKVSGLQQAVAGAVKGNPQAAQFAGGASSDAGAKASYAEHFLKVPAKVLSTGNTWDVPLDVEIPQVGVVSGTVRCKYEGIEEKGGRPLHKVSTTSDLKIEVDIDMDQVKATGVIEVTTSSGKAFFDAEQGVMVSRESSVTMSGNITLIVAGQTIPVDQEQTQKLRVTLIDGPPDDA